MPPEPRPALWRQLVWMAIIWIASVGTLAMVAAVIRWWLKP